jgi:hypothetical protein
MSTPGHGNNDAAGHEWAVPDEQRAVRFFWSVLILATCASVGGNVTHAILNAPTNGAVVAAAAALVIGIRRCQSRPNTPKQCGIGGWPKGHYHPPRHRRSARR